MFKPPVLPKFGDSTIQPFNSEQYVKAQLTKVGAELKTTAAMLKTTGADSKHIELVKHMEAYIGGHSETLALPNRHLHHAKHVVLAVIVASTGMLFVFAILLIHALVKIMWALIF